MRGTRAAAAISSSALPRPRAAANRAETSRWRSGDRRRAVAGSCSDSPTWRSPSSVSWRSGERVSRHVHECADRLGRECGRSLAEGRTRAASCSPALRSVARVRGFWCVLALAVCSVMPGCKAAVPMASLPFDLIVQGAGMEQAGTEPPAAPSYRLLHDAGAWESYWGRIFGTAPPAVDFAREFVLCVHLGTKPTGGYTIAAKGVQFDAEHRRLDCTLELTEPTPGAMLTQALTSPYAIYRVALPTGLPVPLDQVEIRF